MGRRAVFYLPGFDPREPETYWGLFRREARLTAERRGLAIAVGEPRRAEDGISLDWPVTAGSTRTAYSLLRWDAIVRARFPRPEWRRLAAVPALLLRLSRTGYTRSLRKEARRFSTVIYGVHRIYLAFALLSLVLAGSALALIPAEARPWAWPAVPVLAYAVLALLIRLTRGKPLYVAHLVDDTAFTHDHAAGRTPEMPARLDAFAARIAAAEAEGGIDEIVVVGHSSSSFLGVEVLDRILARDPGFGARVPVSFVTLGSVIPWIGLDPAAARIRGALARVAAAEQIAWLDIRAPWDWLSIHLRDPLTASGVPSPGPDRPAVMRVQIEDLIEPRTVARRRWNLFRMHFQLLMSSRKPEAFDYIAFVAGPEPVRAAIDRCRRMPARAAPDTARVA
ncbi:hydrolase [Methylobacterium dankookense]|uniref:hydrolase n=1 Tax=Methylobacterium dankookense TaxID=560405 RepID=UPI00119E87F2|nr:hydrolase [Methylobacterium dankookense]